MKVTVEIKDSGMKTLDEVIKAFEICWEQGTCNEECPYKGQPCTKQREIDALHYLRQYQKDKQIYSYDIARRNLEVAERNDPLSWDELKRMEGKPVWVEGTNYTRWAIITGIYDGEIIRFEGHKLYASESKDDLGKTWQAYRKEKTE